MSRAALHLLLVPHLRGLSLGACPGLVTPALCAHITARCQGLWSLYLSGAQQLSSKLLSETLCCLPALRSLSLAATPCDTCVIRTIAQRCRLLRHLDISRCHFLSPAALLPLGGGASFPFSGGPSASSPGSAPPPALPLCSLLALDIGFGKEEGDAAAAAAYLLLTLPCLETLDLDGLAEACCLIQHGRFGLTDEFSDREGVPRLGEVWREWKHRQRSDRSREEREEARAEDEDEEEEEEEERILLNGYGRESRDEGPRDQAEEDLQDRVSSGDDRLILRLKDVKGVSCESLDSLSRACPNIRSVCVDVEEDVDTRGRSQGSLLASGLRAWAGQLQRLSVRFPGPLPDLLPALDVAGSSLVSLTLQGVKTSRRTPLLEAIKACPRLRDLLISAEPPTGPQDEEDEDDQRDEVRDLPQLPHLCSLTLSFSYEHGQMKPVMSWMSLKRALGCLLTGSPLLEKLSLVSLPCPLDCVFSDVLGRLDLDLDLDADSTDSPRVPLARLRHVELPRTDVTMVTVKRMMQRSKRLKYVDVNHCWQISLQEWSDCKKIRKVQVVWS
ncbi:uncharacterized protein si:ch211-214j8.12 [Etheostoma cragini]|uniref:uncharacterized protein si:ch211-214j8.12 n=1 Tax=Etheostoma cragini TaxID=417921 RepID=UPI00155E29B9|nr:uncharacterized protein si:ch211-214j8.12 [Etheostoma cragini]